MNRNDLSFIKVALKAAGEMGSVSFHVWVSSAFVFL